MRQNYTRKEAQGLFGHYWKLADELLTKYAQQFNLGQKPSYRTTEVADIMEWVKDLYAWYVLKREIENKVYWEIDKLKRQEQMNNEREKWYYSKGEDYE